MLSLLAKQTKVSRLNKGLDNKKKLDEPKIDVVKDDDEKQDIEIEPPQNKKKPGRPKKISPVERFNGPGTSVKYDSINVNELIRRGQILEREMRNQESQIGRTGRPRELHICVGKGYINSTALIKRNALIVKKPKSCDPLIKTSHVSDELKNAILEYLETGEIDTNLNDIDRGKLYSYISTTNHYGNLRPEDFYAQKLELILARAKLAPINHNIKSEFEDLLSNAREKNLLSKTAIRYMDEQAKMYFKFS